MSRRENGPGDEGKQLPLIPEVVDDPLITTPEPRPKATPLPPPVSPVSQPIVKEFYPGWVVETYG